MSRKTRNFLVFSLVLMLSACIAQKEDRGYARATADFDKIIPGTSTNKDVQEMLGSPSSYSTFGDETWFYISSRRETAAFLKPEVKNEQVVAIVFDKAGVVQKVENYSEKDKKDISYSQDRTPTEGNSITIWQQVLGNLGKFNASEGGMPGQHGSSRGGGASPY